MMKRLNNKGITTVEVLVCFVLVVIITVSIYTTVSNFNEKKILEGYKSEIINYKNTLTKDLQDDFIKIGLTHARYETTYENEKTIHTLYCNLKDGTERKLVVEQLSAESSYHVGGSRTQDDYYMIKYGKPDDMIDRDLPDVGHSGYDPIQKKICDADAPDRDVNCRLIQDLSINNVYINITEDNVLSIYIGFYHPDFATKYAINVVCPINYVSSGRDSMNTWNY